MKINNGKEFTVMSYVWLVLAVLVLAFGAGTDLLVLLFIILSELSKVDRGVHTLGRSVAGIMCSSTPPTKPTDKE